MKMAQSDEKRLMKKRRAASAKLIDICALLFVSGSIKNCLISRPENQSESFQEAAASSSS